MHVTAGAVQKSPQEAVKVPPMRSSRSGTCINAHAGSTSKKLATTFLLRDAAGVCVRSLSLCCDVSSQTMHWSTLACLAPTVQHKLAHQWPQYRPENYMLTVSAEVS